MITGNTINELVAANQGEKPKQAKRQNTGGLRGTGQGQLMNNIVEGQATTSGRRAKPDESLDRIGQARANRTKF